MNVDDKVDRGTASGAYALTFTLSGYPAQTLTMSAVAGKTVLAVATSAEPRPRG